MSPLLVFGLCVALAVPDTSVAKAISDSGFDVDSAHDFLEPNPVRVPLSSRLRSKLAMCDLPDPVPMGDRCRHFLDGTLPPGAGQWSEGWSLKTAVPPLLISQPGAGNTMTRMLLEHASGIQTGTCVLVLSTLCH